MVAVHVRGEVRRLGPGQRDASGIGHETAHHLIVVPGKGEIGAAVAIEIPDGQEAVGLRGRQRDRPAGELPRPRAEVEREHAVVGANVDASRAVALTCEIEDAVAVEVGGHRIAGVGREHERKRSLRERALAGVGEELERRNAVCALDGQDVGASITRHIRDAQGYVAVESLLVRRHACVATPTLPTRRGNCALAGWLCVARQWGGSDPNLR